MGLEAAHALGGCRDEIMEIPAVAEVPPPVTRGPQPIAGVPASSFADLYRILHRADVAARWGSHYMAEGIEAVCRDLVDPAEVYVCPHQPSRVVLDKVRHRLGIGENRFASINAEFGNLSSASSPTAASAGVRPTMNWLAMRVMFRRATEAVSVSPNGTCSATPTPMSSSRGTSFPSKYSDAWRSTSSSPDMAGKVSTNRNSSTTW